MLRFVVASCLAAAACGQFVDPKNAKILKEQRFNTGTGQFGSAYAQEDGIVAREETINDKGERTGQYSYIDNSGKTISVKWTAGKDGFRVEGDHIPTGANGLNSAPFNADLATPAPVVASAPVTAAPAPLLKAQPLPPQPQAAPLDYDVIYDDAPVDPNFNPFINPHDPTHRDFRFNTNGANFPTQNNAASQRTAAAVPNCADCAGVNPFINPFDKSHAQVQHLLGAVPAPRAQPAAAGQLAGHLAGHQAGFQLDSRAAALPARPKPVSAAQPLPRPAVRKLADQSPLRQTTVAPIIKNFFPPGQLKLNRFETGFNFDFES